ncbi:MAG TPA: multiheme c-type cytochrome, partial [Enhygromyxa sp.]|nr:multiheme c-type cytochrome [Enhygromyxa sp.]
MKRRLALCALAFLGGCEAESDAPDPDLHADAEPAVVETWIPDEHECEQCHDEVAEQWARSRHHAAFTNPDFARSYAREPLDFCRDCHAPALPRMAATDAEQLGVGCIDCHFDGQTLLAAGSPSQTSSAPHALRYTAEFGTRSCARCHEFDFPEQSWRHGSMMQTTMREHQASPHADRSCATCHMPSADHAFGSTRDDEAMRRAVSITARRDGDALVLTLTPIGVGHAFPTGDLFRRLELHAELVSRDGETLASTT